MAITLVPPYEEDKNKKIRVRYHFVLKPGCTPFTKSEHKILTAWMLAAGKGKKIDIYPTALKKVESYYKEEVEDDNKDE